jgi:hypothetical protein
MISWIVDQRSTYGREEKTWESKSKEELSMGQEMKDRNLFSVLDLFIF